MFFAGGTFGHESEVREANKHQTGRRHQPRDMAEPSNTTASGNNAAAIGGGGGAATKSVAERRVSDQQQMSAGPSFMDRMYAHDASATEPAHAARRHKSGPQDNLNIFSWQEKDTNAKPQAGRGPRAARNVDATAAVPTAEDRRAQESKKFETHSESTFLKFSDAPTEGQPTAAGAKGTRRVSVQGPRENGMMGELMRDQQERPHGKRIQTEPLATANRKKAAAAAAGPDQGVAGFPGMGERSAPRTMPHLNRKPVQSNVFPPSIPPWAQHDDVTADRNSAEGPRVGAPPAPPTTATATATPKPPTYRLDERDYEDHHDAVGDHAGHYQGQPQAMQEIEMYDDGDDEVYARAVQQHQQQQQQGAEGARMQPRWLDEPGESGSGHEDDGGHHEYH